MLDDSQNDKGSIVRFQGGCNYNDSTEHSPLLMKEKIQDYGELINPIIISSTKVTPMTSNSRRGETAKSG